MRRIFFFIFLIVFYINLPPVFADEALPVGRQGWKIDNFYSDISIKNTGEVLISEKIETDFGSLSKHGIYRDIPYIYQSDSRKVYTNISVKSIKHNNSIAKYKVSTSDGVIRIKIGDPNKAITGKNIYEINYIAKGVLRSFADHDELYWNVTGNNWPVEIVKAQASVNLSKDGILKTLCFQGYAGSLGECKSKIENPSLAKFQADGSLAEAKGMTIAVSYKKGLVPILNVEKPKTFWEKFTSWPSITTIFIGIIFGGGTALYYWLKKGRDYWFGSGVFGKKSDSGAAKPIGAYETTVVEYTPPEGLRPAEIGVLMDEKADTLDVVSTIIDLASRGFLTITEIDKKWLFGKTDYQLKSLGKDKEELLSYEKMLLTKLFIDGDEVTVSSLKKTFYTDLKEIKDELYKDVVQKNLFFENPETVRERYLGMAIFMIFIGGFSIAYTIGWDQIFLTDLAFGLIVSGIVLLVISRFMPRRTAYGREMYRRVKGYRLFIEKAETYRQRFFEKKNLFNEVLPYAIMFGLTGKFAAAMKDMGLQNNSPIWYSGVHPFNTSTFGSSMTDFSSSMSSAIASAPSSSGGFSGGGSSGGGFGGGGGGSW